MTEKHLAVLAVVVILALVTLLFVPKVHKTCIWPNLEVTECTPNITPKGR